MGNCSIDYLVASYILHIRLIRLLMRSSLPTSKQQSTQWGPQGITNVEQI